MQQVARATEPAEERREGEAVEGGDVAGSLRVQMAGMAVTDMRLTDMAVTEVQAASAGEGGEDREDEAEEEADEEDGVHLRAFLRRRNPVSTRAT